MGLGHIGLCKLIQSEAKVDCEKLEDQDLILCINGHGDKMKVIGCKGLVLGYLRMPRGQRIMKEALQFIPRTFGAGSFDYDAAVRKALEVRLHSGESRRGPLNEARAKAAAGV